VICQLNSRHALPLERGEGAAGRGLRPVGEGAQLLDREPPVGLLGDQLDGPVALGHGWRRLRSEDVGAAGAGRAGAVVEGDDDGVLVEGDDLGDVGGVLAR
jgi:hypothetical protein